MARKEGVVNQKELINKMYDMAEGAYAKYELEDMIKIFRKTMFNLLLEGREIDIDNVVSFRQRPWKNNSGNWKPVKPTLKTPLRETIAVKAVVSSVLKNAIREKYRAQQEAVTIADLKELGLITRERKGIESVAELQQLS